MPMVSDICVYDSVSILLLLALKIRPSLEILRCEMVKFIISVSSEFLSSCRKLLLLLRGENGDFYNENIKRVRRCSGVRETVGASWINICSRGAGASVRKQSLLKSIHTPSPIHTHTHPHTPRELLKTRSNPQIVQ